MQLEDELGISVPNDAVERFQTIGDILEFLLPKLAEVDERTLERFAQRSSLRRSLIARAVGIGAVKYADLCRDRTGDYVFNWDNMLAFQGNTAPYMMYAHARIRSIYRKAAERFGEPDVYAAGVTLRLEHERELALGLRLSRFRESLDAVADDLTPHVLCTYLFELAQEFMRFYESCPVLAAPDEPTRLSRMRLCDITARTLRLGLNLLGIEALERM
ncbi:MAG: arginine--tRNA ligase [Phycisphaerae bacterium]|nr:arginine--tRNA ligase [Phycisphaerae bacterium]